jgi:hypothetical protein
MACDGGHSGLHSEQSQGMPFEPLSGRRGDSHSGVPQSLKALGGIDVMPFVANIRKDGIPYVAFSQEPMRSRGAPAHTPATLNRGLGHNSILNERKGVGNMPNARHHRMDAPAASPNQMQQVSRFKRAFATSPASLQTFTFQSGNAKSSFLQSRIRRVNEDGTSI